MDSPDCVFRYSPECVFRDSPECVFSEEEYSGALPFEAALLSFGLLVIYEYYTRTLMARVPTAKAFCALSPHVAGAADSGNYVRLVGFMPGSISPCRIQFDRLRVCSFSHFHDCPG